MLEGLLKAGFQLTGTWPMRTEMKTRQIAMGKNALASSIVLVCRPRSEAASITTRKDFLSSLKKELPHALRDLQKGNIAPVDLAQAAIGPGMAVFSRYKKVLETDGSPMRVRTALALINQGLDEVLSELESEFDPYTRWALAWFEQHQFDEGAFGEAEVLATAKALSISHLAEAGILHSRAGKVRLLRREELPEDWDPSRIDRLTVWEVTQHLIRRLDQKGEKETANLKAKIGGMAEIARDLAYRLYTLCERKGWADEAGYYNSLVVAWPSMASEAFELSGS
jgi:putative DNA methylase